MEQERREVAAEAVRSHQLHVQTLVDMNHSVSTARRDAAFKCLMDYASANESTMREESIESRLAVYKRCSQLIVEALMTTQRSSLSYERMGVLDRPAVHILKMLEGMINTITALASHVGMVRTEAELMREQMGVGTYSALVTTCQTFESNERVARNSFLEMLYAGRMVLESSTARHREQFTADDERRYHIAYEEFVRHYSQPERPFTVGGKRVNTQDNSN